MFKAYTYEIPDGALSLIRSALDISMGEGIVTLEELNKGNLKSSVRLSSRGTSVLFSIISVHGAEICGDMLKDTNKVFVYEDSDRDLVRFLNEELSIDMPLPEIVVETIEETKNSEENTELITQLIGEISSLKVELERKDEILATREDQLENYKNLLTEFSNSVDSETDSSSQVTALTKQLEDLNLMLEVKEDTITELNDELQRLNTSLKTKDSAIENFERIIKSKDSEKEVKSLRDKIDSLSKKVSNAEEDLKKDRKTIVDLNREKLELKKEIDNLKNENKSNDLVDWMTRATKAEKTIEEFEKSLAGELALACKDEKFNFKTKDIIPHLSNIEFIFTASQGYEKEAYRKIYQSLEISGLQAIAVDTITASFMEYVFGIKGNKEGFEWFKNGGNINNFICPCNSQKIFTLSPAPSFFNELFLLEVDWVSRLQELNSLGVKVIIFAGSLNTVIGKYLYSIFNNGKNTVRVLSKASLVFIWHAIQQVINLDNRDKIDFVIFETKENKINNSISELLKNAKSAGAGVTVLREGQLLAIEGGK